MKEDVKLLYSTTYNTPVGKVTLASDGENLVGLWLEGQKYHGNKIFARMEVKDDLPVFTATKNWIIRYFAKDKPVPGELPLAPIGGEFRQDVWQALCDIPNGKTITYGEIAKKIAAKRNRINIASQAVGGAVGHNPLSIIIPCHRVVGSDGNLTGYAGGIDIKIKLLEHEGADMTGTFTPKKLGS